MDKTFTIQWLENKEYNGTKLIEVSTTTGEKFTIWEKDTKGQVFPDFDKIQNGGTVTGNLYTSPKNGKMTLYPPKAKGGFKGSNSAAITKNMEKKQENIAEFQENKQHSMKIMAAYRDATLMVTHFLPSGTSDVIIRQEHKVWVKYFLDEISSSLNTPF